MYNNEYTSIDAWPLTTKLSFSSRKTPQMYDRVFELNTNSQANLTTVAFPRAKELWISVTSLQHMRSSLMMFASGSISQHCTDHADPVTYFLPQFFYEPFGRYICDKLRAKVLVGLHASEFRTHSRGRSTQMLQTCCAKRHFGRFLRARCGGRAANCMPLTWTPMKA